MVNLIQLHVQCACFPRERGEPKACSALTQTRRAGKKEERESESAGAPDT
jgi:hypothetical protein